MKTSDRLAEIQGLQKQHEAVSGRVKGLMESVGAGAMVGGLGKASKLANAVVGGAMAGGAKGAMTEKERKQMGRIAPRPTLGQRIKRMTEWFSPS